MIGQKWLAPSVVAWLAVTSMALAQETTTGSIAGRVVDVHAAGLPGAIVTLRSGEGARALVTDAHGQFLAPYLTPGVYALRVERPGFKTLEQRDVRVRLGQRVELDYTLSLGAFEEDIPTLAQAPEIRALIKAEVDRVNANYAQVEQVKKFAILDHDLSQPTGELTPTLKVKRNVVNDKYADIFDSLYSS